MKDANELHNQSMSWAELAILARMRGDHEDANGLFEKSLKFELEAIEVIDRLPYSEPSYSILHRSAATLALDCNNPRTAEILISKALAKNPPLQIAEELRDLLEQVYFSRHLQLRGITLNEDELQMSLAGGQRVGFGVVQSSEFLQRVDDASKIIYRIVERRQNKPFREKGRMAQTIKDGYELFMSVPRAASFAVTLKLGRPSTQPKLPGLSDTSEIVNEFMALMGLVNKADFSAIEARIPDIAYRTNFVQLAKRLAPDGDNIKIVGFTSIHGGQEKFVGVTRHKSKIVSTGSSHVGQAEEIVVTGILLFADAVHEDSGRIKIVDAGKKPHIVKVPEGMMNDIVKPLWGKKVVIKGIKQQDNIIVLQDIEEQTEEQ